MKHMTMNDVHIPPMFQCNVHTSCSSLSSTVSEYHFISRRVLQNAHRVSRNHNAFRSHRHVEANAFGYSLPRQFCDRSIEFLGVRWDSACGIAGIVRSRDRDVDGRRDFGGVFFVPPDVWIGREFDRRENIAQIPAHLIVVDTFMPYDISTTSAGYAYGVVETAVMWICEYAESHRLIES